MYTCYFYQGKDRGGLQYRYMAYEMLGKLQVNLEASFHDPKTTDSTANTKYQRALSRTLWGIYCFESITALSYLQPSMVQAPTIPRRFMSGYNIDPEIIGYTSTDEEPQLSEHILNAMCDLSDWLYPAMTGDITNESNLRARLLQEMRCWRNSMFPFPSARASGTPGMCYLSQYSDLVALRLLLLPLNSNPLMDDSGATDTLCLQHCARILERSELYWELCTSGNRSVMCILPLYHAAAVALTQMEEYRHQAYDLCERACLLMEEHVEGYPIALYLLRALEVIAKDMGLPLSSAALRTFRKSSLVVCGTTDVPVAIVIPVSVGMIKLSPMEGRPGASQMGIKVEDLVSKRLT